MMIDVEKIFLDTNILIYVTDPESPWHEHAVNTIDQLRESEVEMVISYQVLREFLAVATNDSCNSR